MRLYVPPLGTELTLTSDWIFDLHDEHRNSDFINVILGLSPSMGWDEYWKAKEKVKDSIVATIPAGSVLKVDRIYIRKGQGDFDSISFWLTDCPNKAWAPKKMGGTAEARLRFWAKLDDANKIEF